MRAGLGGLSRAFCGGIGLPAHPGDPPGGIQAGPRKAPMYDAGPKGPCGKCELEPRTPNLRSTNLRLLTAHAVPSNIRVEQFNWTTDMALVAVKNKYQVVIPEKVREKIRVKVGDLLEARAERGKITFTPKSVVDRGIAESLADFKEGRAYGPFRTPRELVASLHVETAKLRSKKRSGKTPRR